ncbi:oxidoreductase [Opitutus sp. GAS368]|jgi:NAD(P)-dependent dehydrogenase (short-subunit alcohol dehydrogenase family)|uniref:oxidoreductase n=1 Tax=Opitutus sp. GAS368 TaxID=1882749 RepID=UPI00087BE618|nr:oxidoreductase [Opitutus sp. GAS368]SDS09799.1 Short-chain dehydrogenase [Opitutus sp. GAS368]
MAQRIWFITGVSSGLGRSLAEAVAARGDIAVGTLRQDAQLAVYSALAPGRTVGVKLDVNDHAQVNAVVSQVIKQFGRIDVLVNNAGYGLLGAVEEVSDAEARAQLETNVFGALAVTRAVLPHLRRQKSGHILQISSIGGFNGTPGAGIYNASKFALEGFSEAIAKETAPLGIRVTLVEPGPFRTKWAGESLKRAAAVIPDYAATPAGATIARITGYGATGSQPGDPDLAAGAMIKAVDSPNPPLRLVLGALAIGAFRAKLEAARQELAAWEAIGLATDAPPKS